MDGGDQEGRCTHQETGEGVVEPQKNNKNGEH